MSLWNVLDIMCSYAAEYVQYIVYVWKKVQFLS